MEPHEQASATFTYYHKPSLRKGICQAESAEACIPGHFRGFLRRRRNFFLLLISAILFWAIGNNAFCEGNPARLRDVPPIHEKTLDNGLKIAVQHASHHDLVAIEILCKTGSLYEGKWAGSGISHLTEHMLFDGSLNYSKDKIEDKVKELGGTINGFTGMELTGYTLVLPAENFRAGMEILADMVKNPLYDKKEIAREKRVVIGEMRMDLDDPQRYLYRLFKGTAYSRAPYDLPVIGYPALLDKITRRDLVAFHNKWYVPNNMIVAIAGDVKPKTAFDTVKKLFADYPMRYFPLKNVPAPLPLRGRRIRQEAFPVKTTLLSLGFASVKLTDNDSATLDVLALLLGQENNSLLYKSLVKDKKLAYSVSAYNYTPLFRGVFAINAVIDYRNKDAAIKDIFAQVAALKKKKVPSRELEKAKNIYLAQYLFGQETVQSQAGTIASDIAYTNDPYFSQKYIKNISGITPEDIRRCARRYLDKQNYACVILHPPLTGQRKEGTKKAETAAKPEKIVLKNGIRVILKPDRSLPTVSLLAVVGGGVRYESEKDNGTFDFLSRLLASGSKKYPADKLDAELDSLGSDVSPFSGYNSYGLSMDLLSKDLPKGLDIFSDLLMHPEFSPAKFAEIKRNIANDIRTRNDDIFSLALRQLRKNLFTSYPYRMDPSGTLESLNKISLADLKNTQEKFFVPGNIVLAVCGDFDRKTVLERLKKEFSSLSGKEVPQPVFNEPERTAAKTVEKKADKKQAVVVVGFPAPDILNKDRLGLRFLVSLLSSPGSYLYGKIREDLGLSYTLGGQVVSGRDSGYFFIYVACKPGNTAKVRKIIEEQISAIKEQLPAEKDMDMTRNYLLGRFRLDLEADSSYAFVSALDELYGLGFDEPEKFSSKIKQITAADIQRLAGKYLKTKKSVTVIIRR